MTEHPPTPAAVVTQSLCFGAASFWYIAEALYQAAPPWTVVPPLGFMLCSLWNAYTNYRRLKVWERTQQGPEPR